MIVEKNKVVTVTYSLQVDNGETGPVQFEEVTESNPFIFLFGAGGVLPGLEDAMQGKAAGEEFVVFLDFENGYGDYDESKKVIIPKSNFKEDGKKNRDLLKVGQVIPMQDDKGNQMRGEITKVDYRGVHMDFNSPLAGFDLHFLGKIIAIRDAEPIEIEHGHVHGAGGHQH